MCLLVATYPDPFALTFPTCHTTMERYSEAHHVTRASEVIMVQSSNLFKSIKLSPRHISRMSPCDDMAAETVKPPWKSLLDILNSALFEQCTQPSSSFARAGTPMLYA